MERSGTHRCSCRRSTVVCWVRSRTSTCPWSRHMVRCRSWCTSGMGCWWQAQCRRLCCRTARCLCMACSGTRRCSCRSSTSGCLAHSMTSNHRWSPHMEQCHSWCMCRMGCWLLAQCRHLLCHTGQCWRKASTGTHRCSCMGSSLECLGRSTTSRWHWSQRMVPIRNLCTCRQGCWQLEQCLHQWCHTEAVECC